MPPWDKNAFKKQGVSDKEIWEKRLQYFGNRSCKVAELRGGANITDNKVKGDQCKISAISNEELATRIQKGERDLMPELWQQVEKFVRLMARKRFAQLPATSGLELDDLYNTGYIAVVEAVNRFDEVRGCSFLTLLYLTLKTAFAEAAGYRLSRQRQDPLHSAESLYAPLSDENDDSLGETIPDPAAAAEFDDAENRIYNEQLHEALDVALSTLGENRQAVIRARYYKNMSFADIARAQNKSRETIRMTEARAMNDLRKPYIRKRLEAFLDLHTDYYHHVGIRQFNTTGTSAVEKIVIRRENLREQWRKSQ